MEIDKLNSWLLKNYTDDSSTATHMVWKNPSLTPAYVRMASNNNHFAELNKSIALSFVQSYDKRTMKFLGKGLPSVHEVANEVFPLFMDIDHIPVTTSMENVKKLISAACTLIGRCALEISEGTTVTVFVNNPDWMVHDKEWLPKSAVTPDKYGAHIYFQSNEEGERPMVTSSMMKAISSWINQAVKKKCPHKDQTSDERKENKRCLVCQFDVDVQMWDNDRPKLRMAYCDKGHPYQTRYYGLCCRLKWDGSEVSFFFLSFLFSWLTKKKVCSRWFDRG
jgi:hypothetical protein